MRLRVDEPALLRELMVVCGRAAADAIGQAVVPLLARSGRVIGLFGISREISERKRAEKELLRQAGELAHQARALEHLSVRDELTGLLNRRGFLTLGRPLFEQARETDTAISLLYVDVNGLKRINDEHGHTCGDTALLKTAELLRANTRKADILARLGGDEFCIRVVGDGAVGERVSKRVWAAARGKKGRGGDRPFKLSLKSVGLAHQQLGDLDSLEQLLERADSLMHGNRRHVRTER